MPGSALRRRRTSALTLVEVMFALFIQATVMLAIISSFIHSRRATEGAVLHAASTSVIYGIIEQIKQLEYTTSLPYNGRDADPANGITADPTAPDPTDPAATAPPNIRVRINQSTVKWLRVVYTPALANGTADTPKGPTTTPSPTAPAAGIGADGSNAIDNWIGAIPLSTVTGSLSQQINLNIWVWIDEIPDAYVSEVKKITIVYTYSYMDGNKEKFVRDREVIIRTRFDK